MLVKGKSGAVINMDHVTLVQARELDEEEWLVLAYTVAGPSDEIGLGVYRTEEESVDAIDEIFKAWAAGTKVFYMPNSDWEES